MNILHIDYTLQLQSLDIYLSGCNGNPHCKNCHNPESWDFTKGKVYNELYFNKIKQQINDFDLLIHNIMIFGGEPLDNSHDELLHLLFDLKMFNKKIWFFTRYGINEIPKEIKSFCNYIKTGRYIEELKCNDNIQYGIKLATSNQKIYKL